MKEELEQWLGAPVEEVKKLFGDASYRTYYRVRSAHRSFVLMELPEGKLSASEEITNLASKPSEMPFLNVQRFLKNLNVSVPTIEKYSETHRWVLLEDLGDTKLFDLVAKTDEKTLLSWYQKALDLLIELKNKTLHPTAMHQQECVAFQRSFDAALFNWEWDHFREYGLEARGISLTSDDQKHFTELTQKITQELLELPQGFTHRDYQSRNLMWYKNQLYLIDFQDALIGPAIYDVVSLLRDSYVALSPKILDTLLQYYCQKTGKSKSVFQNQFDLQTVQRKLKDAGRFVYIDRVKRNPNFLPYLPASLGYVREALTRLTKHQDLLELLSKYIPEWR